jgi:ABC-type glycerol-3-phosphate transport system substrate-binding protein
MLKRFLPCLTILVLAACTAPVTPQVVPPEATPFPSATPLPATAESTPVITQADLEALDGLELAIWHIWRGPSGAAFDQLVADFNAANPYGIAIRVTAEYKGGISEMPPALTAGLNAGGLPDIAVLMPYQYNAWRVSGGPLADLTTYADDPFVGYPAGADFYPVMWARDLQDGLRWGMPFAPAAQVILVNQSLIDTNPADFESLHALACFQFMEAESHALNLQSWLAAADLSLLNEDGDYAFDNRAVEAVFTELNDWSARGCLRQPALFDLEEVFARQGAALIAASTSSFAEIKTIQADNSVDDQWTVLPFFAPSGGQAITVYGPSLVVLSQDARRQAASWLFLRYLMENSVDFTAAGEYLPIRVAAAEQLAGYGQQHPQWQAAVDLLPFAVAEPSLASYSEVRRVLTDAAFELLSPSTEPQDIPDLLFLLQSTADEIAAEFP